MLRRWLLPPAGSAPAAVRAYWKPFLFQRRPEISRMDEKSSQSQWESHTRDEGRALEKQQSDAGPTHGPVGETVGERLQAGAESAADVERLRCARIAARWSDPPTFLDVTGPLEVEAARAVQRVVRAIEAEIRGEPPP